MHKPKSIITAITFFANRGRLIIFLDLIVKIDIIILIKFVCMLNNKAQILKNNNNEVYNILSITIIVFFMFLKHQLYHDLNYFDLI